MQRRSVLKLALTAPLLASRRAWSQSKTVTLWYPAGDITAGAAHFSDKSFFAPYEAKTGVKVEAVGLDYDTMQQKIFAATADLAFRPVKALTIEPEISYTHWEDADADTWAGILRFDRKF